MPGFSPSKDKVTIEVGGKNVNKTYYDWYVAISTSVYSDANNLPKLEKDSTIAHNSQVYILSQLEVAYLKELQVIPMYALGSASLLSYKVKFGIEDYISLIGRGGIQYLTYNYSDVEWDKVKGNVQY